MKKTNPYVEPKVEKAAILFALTGKDPDEFLEAIEERGKSVTRAHLRFARLRQRRLREAAEPLCR